VASFLLLFSVIGLLPLALGLVLTRDMWRGFDGFPLIAWVLHCALAFNLTFFWQELWLVIPKALVPGLHPVLFHNNHEWAGTSPVAELLQGTGAIATLASGLTFALRLRYGRLASPSARLFCFWMAFEGLYQSLTQLAVGTILPGNDVGRALTYLGVGAAGDWALLVICVAAMGLAGRSLASLLPDSAAGNRTLALPLLAVVLLSIIVIVPFRLPRNLIEVVLIPLVVNLIGTGWLTIGLAVTPPSISHAAGSRPTIVGAACALLGVLLFFQIVLRPGLHF
jgi:hypothetical protein